MRDGRRQREARALGLIMAAICSAVGSGVLEASDGPMLALPVWYEAGEKPWHAAAGDLNADGLVDLVVVDLWGRDIQVLLSRGGGLFHWAVEQDTGGDRPCHVVLGDVNGDGALDAVVANYHDDIGDIEVLFGDGEGELDRSGYYQTSDSSLASVLADLNGDGWLDLVVETQADTVPVLLNNGDGSFAEAVEYPVSESAGPVLAVDVNLDGWTDLVTASASIDPGDRAQLHVLRNDGEGQFEPAVVYEATGVAEVITSVVSEDLNGDGWPDVALLASTEEWDADGSLFVFLNAGDGSFGEAVTHNAGVHPHTLVSADWNGDGALDLALANRGYRVAAGVSVLLNDGAGGYGAPVFHPMGSRSSSVAEADLDGDGAVDLVVTGNAVDNFNSGAVILRNDGAGGFEPTEDQLLGHEDAGPLIVDLDGRDGLDLVRMTYDWEDGEGNVVVALNNGKGAFASPTGSYEVTGWPRGAVFGDVNKDGAIDAVLRYSGYPSDADKGAAILMGDGMGGFQEAAYYSTGIPTSGGPVLGDLNNDDWLDLILLNRATDDQESSFTVALNDGAGVFGEVMTYPVGASDYIVELVDLSGDGVLDVIINAGEDEEILVFLNDGDATFGDPARYPGARPGRFATSDFDGDGSTDLALLNCDKDELAVYRNDGVGAFDVIDRYATHASRSDVAAGDVNGDGWTDLVIGGNEPIQVFFNEGNGSFSSSDLNDARGAVKVVDLDRDGYLDVVCSERTEVYAFYGDVDGGLTRRGVGEDVEVGAGPICIDVNADNWLDVILVNDTEVVAYVNQGDREYKGAEWYRRRDLGNEELHWADIDGDGLSDLVAVASSEDAVLVYLNQCADPCAGDVDGDGDTDQSDLGSLLASFDLPSDDPLFEPRADLDGDGEVGHADLGMLLADYECGVGKGS